MRKASRRVAVYGGCLAGLAIAFMAGGTWAGLDGKAAVFDGIVESTFGGFMFPDGSVQTSAAALTSGFRVRDSVGVDLGPVYGWTLLGGSGLGDWKAYFLFDYGGERLFMFLDKDSIEPFPPTDSLPLWVYYDKADCTGTPYLRPIPSNYEVTRAVSTIYAIGYGDMLYKTDKEKPGFEVLVPSRSVGGDVCEICNPICSILDPWLTEEALDLSIEFTPPFYVE